MPPLEKLVGPCGMGMHNVCTMRGNFHLFLRNLGKTNTSDPAEGQYIGPRLRRSQDIVDHKGRVFLYEVSQLSDNDKGRSSALRLDLQQFLGLNEPIAPFIWFKPGKNHSDEHLARVNLNKIDICDDKFNIVRSTLMKQSTNASNWIREYFIDAPDVLVSSKDHFTNVIMKAWHEDPCLGRANNKPK
jgi:hypothetical protein